MNVPFAPKYNSAPAVIPSVLTPVNTPSVITNPKSSFGIFCVAIPKVLAELPSVNKSAGAIKGLSPVAPTILTTVPLLICTPVTFLQYTSVCNVRNDIDDDGTNCDPLYASKASKRPSRDPDTVTKFVTPDNGILYKPEPSPINELEILDAEIAPIKLIEPVLTVLVEINSSTDGPREPDFAI